MYTIVILSGLIGFILFGVFIKVFTMNSALKHSGKQIITTKQNILTYLMLICSIMWIVQAIALFLNFQSQLLRG